MCKGRSLLDKSFGGVNTKLSEKCEILDYCFTKLLKHYSTVVENIQLQNGISKLLDIFHRLINVIAIQEYCVELVYDLGDSQIKFVDFGDSNAIKQLDEEYLQKFYPECITVTNTHIIILAADLALTTLEQWQTILGINPPYYTVNLKELFSIFNNVKPKSSDDNNSNETENLMLADSDNDDEDDDEDDNKDNDTLAQSTQSAQFAAKLQGLMSSRLHDIVEAILFTPVRIINIGEALANSDVSTREFLKKGGMPIESQKQFSKRLEELKIDNWKPFLINVLQIFEEIGIGKFVECPRTSKIRSYFYKRSPSSDYESLPLEFKIKLAILGIPASRYSSSYCSSSNTTLNLPHRRPARLRFLYGKKAKADATVKQLPTVFAKECDKIIRTLGPTYESECASKDPNTVTASDLAYLGLTKIELTPNDESVVNAFHQQYDYATEQNKKNKFTVRDVWQKHVLGSKETILGLGTFFIDKNSNGNGNGNGNGNSTNNNTNNKCKNNNTTNISILKDLSWTSFDNNKEDRLLSQILYKHLPKKDSLPKNLVNFINSEKNNKSRRQTGSY